MQETQLEMGKELDGKKRHMQSHAFLRGGV